MTTTTTAAAIHIKVWSGSRSARVTEMINAGKRGKVCRVMRFQGIHYAGSGGDVVKKAQDLTCEALWMLEHDVDGMSFDDVLLRMQMLAAEAKGAGVSEGYFSVDEDTIKGIKAPRAVLTAGVEGKWYASADETGISMRQTDDVNQWSEITPSSQTGAAAYAAAAQVWAQVEAAATLSQAAEILRNAGAKLHGYCGLD